MCWSCSPHFYLRNDNLRPDILRSSHPEASFGTAVLKHFTKFPGNRQWWSCFLRYKIKKHITPNELFLQKFLKFFRAAFLALPGDCLCGTKNLQEVAVLEIAVLKFEKITRKLSIIKCFGS